MADDPTGVVRSFCAAWAACDIDGIMEYFHDDAVYHNIPVDPVVGRDAIRSMIEMFTSGVERMDFRVDRIALAAPSSAGDDPSVGVVLTERLDTFVFPHATVELPVMGAFEVRAGKIAAWRDYFDLQQYMTQAQPPAGG